MFLFSVQIERLTWFYPRPGLNGALDSARLERNSPDGEGIGEWWKGKNREGWMRTEGKK